MIFSAVKKAIFPYLLPCLIVACLAGARWLYNTGYDEGVSTAQARCDRAESDRIQFIGKKYLSMAQDKQAVEERLEAASANIQNLYKHRVKQNENRVQALSRNIHAGTLQLRIPTAQSANNIRSDSSGTTTSAATLGRADGRAQTQLSESDSLFFVHLGAEADRNVHQLTACQHRLKLCDGHVKALTTQLTQGIESQAPF